MIRVTLSTLQRAYICPASAVLPRVANVGPRSDLGSALHEWIERFAASHQEIPSSHAREEIANRWNLDGIERATFYARSIDFRPAIPAGALCEVALGLFEDGSVRRIEGGRGEYADLPGLILAGTIDCMWAEPLPLWVCGPDEPCDCSGPCSHSCPEGSTLIVPDWKTGDDRHVPPPDRNWQLRAGALLAARWTGATRVIPALCHVERPPEGQETSEGRWEMGTPIDAVGLDAIALELGTVLADVEGASVHEVERFGIFGPYMTTGPHCEYCPARSACPAHTAEVRALVVDGHMHPMMGTYDALSPAEASALAGTIGRARKVIGQAEGALREHVVAHGPILLADGRLWGPQATERVSLATRPAYEALAAEVGEAPADEAFRVTKNSIADVIGKAHEAAGVKREKGKAIARVMTKIAEAGGVSKVPGERWGAYYPGALPERGNDDE